MVVVYELMFTVDGAGFYLEDMPAVTNGGVEIVMPGLPYTAPEIEAAMAKRASPRVRSRRAGAGAARSSCRRCRTITVRHVLAAARS